MSSLNECTIVIQSLPQAQGRPRFAVRGKHAFAFDPHKDKKNWYRLQISQQFNELLGNPVELKIVYFMPIPKDTSKKKKVLMLSNDNIKHVKKPDIDNLLKMTLDCMTGIVFEDDRQIWRLEAEKRYSDSPRTEITIYWTNF